MSSYINFFVKYNDVYSPIGSFSRSNRIYQLFSGTFEQLKPLTQSFLDKAILNIKEERINLKKDWEKNKEKINIIQKMNNSIDEKCNMIVEIEREQEEIEELIDENIFTENFCLFLNCILDETYSMDNVDRDNYIYYGVEVPNPNKKE